MQDDDDDEGASSSTSSSKRDRSPNYPSLTFTEALAKVRKIWESEQKHLVSSELAAKHAGYNKLNGASVPALAAMKRYGLLHGAPKKEVRVTDDAHFIFVHPEDAPERLAMMRKLAMMPALFSEVLAAYPDGLPSDANLKAKLRYQWKFASDEAADAFILSLRDAIKLRDSAPDFPVSASDKRDETTSEAVEDRSVVNSAAVASRPQSPAIPKVQMPVSGQGQARPWDLGDGVVMTVVLPQTGLTKKNVARLKKYVQALEMESSIAWEDEAES
ncbi:MAG: hypothetical protein M3680_01330 [Myxococcota bacterium]|nr:hypothetical protein [Myxococcota bacterium]